MKKIATRFSAIALMALALTSCNKKDNVASEADKEFQSSLDVTEAQMIVTDIDMMVGQASEYAYMSFYSTFGAAGNNTCTIVRDTINKQNTITFNNAKGADGITRNGSIVVSYVNCSTGTVTAPGQLYYRNPNHQSIVTLNNFKYGKYKVAVASGSTFKIANTTPAGYTRSVTPLSWQITTSLEFKDTTDNSGAKDFTWSGSISKTLANSILSTVHPAANLPIVWTTTNNAVAPGAINAEVTYKGTVTGKTSGTVDYTYTIKDDAPLKRKFGCSPDYYIAAQYHPIVGGTATLKTGSKSLRTINYGAGECNNSGEITIDGITYTLDFMK